MSKFFNRLGGLNPKSQPAPAERKEPNATKPRVAAVEKEEPKKKKIVLKPGRKKTGPKSVEHRVRNNQGHFVSREAVDLDGKTQEVDMADYPFLNARYYTLPNGEIMTDVNFNAAFVAKVDEKFEDDPDWDRTMPNNAKVAMFLYAVMEQAVEPYLSAIPDEGKAVPEGYDPMENIPAMAVRGGVENKTVIDLGKMTRKNRMGEL